MKKITTCHILSIIAIAIQCITTNAQTISGSHQLRANDYITRQEAAFVTNNKTGQGVVWDFSELELYDNTLSAEYTEEDECPGKIVGTEYNARYYYQPASDSLLLWGFENNLSKVEYNRPELQLHMPLAYGDSCLQLFHGTGCFCERVFIRMFGTTQVKVDGMGMMLLPGGDTLRHVTRVHIQKLKTEELLRDIMSSQELQAYVNAHPYSTDSILTKMQDGRCLMQSDTYRWYAAGYRYPILETVTIGLLGEEPEHALAFYCSPQEQTSLYDPENEQLRQTLAKIDSQTGGSSTNEDDNGDGNMYIQNISVSVNGQTITVNYDLSRDMTVQALVCDVMGVVYRQLSQAGLSASANQITIPCDGLHSGQYVLYLNANGNVISRTVSL